MFNSYSDSQLIISKYLPENAVDLIVDLIIKYDFKLEITKPRTYVLSDFKPAGKKAIHKISINNNLNKYSFVISLLHEIARLDSYLSSKKENTKIRPHGKEWQESYKQLMQPFLTLEVFPNDVLLPLKNFMQNPPSATYSDSTLVRSLKEYNVNDNTIFLDELSVNSQFQFQGNRIFQKKEQRGKRFVCFELKTNKSYLFNPLTEVIPLNTHLRAS